MDENAKWKNYYQNRVGESYADYCAIRYKPLIQIIENFKPATLTEEGCGIGTITKILHRNNPLRKYSISDLYDGQLELAKQNLNIKNLHITQNNILTANNKSKSDIVFSHGVLEHFGNSEIEDIIYRQKQFANKAVIHYVPLAGWEKPSFGDERLLPLAYWIEKFSPNVFEIFNDGKDCVLVWNS